MNAPSRSTFINEDLLSAPRLYHSRDSGGTNAHRETHVEVRAGDAVLFIADGRVTFAGHALSHTAPKDGLASAEFDHEEFFTFEPPLPIERLKEVLGSESFSDDPGVFANGARESVLGLLEESARGFGDWFEPTPRLWLSAASENTFAGNPKLVWPAGVTEACRHGDFVLIWSDGVGFTALARTIGNVREPKREGRGPKESCAVSFAAFGVPVNDSEALGPSVAVRDLVQQRIIESADSGQTDFLDDTEFWPPLRILILQRNPDLQPVFDSLERSSGAHRLMSRIPGYARDAASGRPDADLLSMQADFRMLASLVTAKAVEPPLAVGLFGEWGSGKSFFIQQVKREVAGIADRARAARVDASTRVYFHGDVVQIEFNAWHYADGDLWASLVDHLFTSLRDELRRKRGDDKKADEEMSNLLKELDTVERVEAAATVRSAELQKKIQDATGKVDNATDSLATEEKNLAEARRRDAWDDVTTEVVTAELRARLETEARELGVGVLATDARTLVEFGRRVAALGGRGQMLWHALRREGLSGWKIGSLAAALGGGLIAGPLIAAAGRAGWIPADFSGFFATATQVVMLVGGGLKWLVGRAQWINLQLGGVERFLDTVQQAATEVEKKVKANEKARAEDITAAEGKIAALRVELEAAQRTRAEAERQQIQLLAQITARLPEKKLADFIEERANSKDYREKLGVMALIRRDFERLSELLLLRHRSGKEYEEARRRLRLRNEAPLPAIDRIVLYIDDLDRCTERKVVDVLRAVHLLLAYELFIVVVAVDAKWVAHALETVHPDMLASGRKRPEAAPTAPGFIAPQATAADYLEKIFQVPFWLPTFSESASRRMIRGLLRGQLDAKAPAGGMDQNIDELIAKGSAVHATATPRPIVTPRQPPAKVEMAPENLDISPGELIVLVKVAPLAGDTPRQAKRFSNLYRLLKVGLTKGELKAFLGRNTGPPTFPAAALLLALVTGTPRATAELFDLLRSMPGKTELGAIADALGGQPIASLRSAAPELYARIETDREVRETGRRLGEVAELFTDPITAAQLCAWIPSVGRFAFSPTGGSL